MSYNERKNILFQKLDKTLINNKYYFELYNIRENFFDIYINSIAIYDVSYNDLFLDVSILFEFLLKNYYCFTNILKTKNANIKETDTESIDILCFLNANIYIIENLHLLFDKLNISDDVIENCLNFNNLNFIDVNENIKENYKIKILGFFNKIIESHSKLLS